MTQDTREINHYKVNGLADDGHEAGVTDLNRDGHKWGEMRS